MSSHGWADKRWSAFASRLYRKAAGREAKLCYMGHATMENRHGLAVAGTVTFARNLSPLLYVVP